MLGGIVWRAGRNSEGGVRRRPPEKSADSIVRGPSSLSSIRVVIDTHRSVKNVIQSVFPADVYGISGNGHELKVNSDNCLTPVHTGRTIHKTVGDYLRPSTNEYTRFDTRDISIDRRQQILSPRNFRGSSPDERNRTS
jgi:hypothetical protein